MEHKSPFLAIRRLDTQLSGMLSGLDLYELPRPEQKLISGLRREVTDVRLDIRDYELSETRAEQLRKAKDAKKLLAHIRGEILTASEYNVFSAIDVAQLTAQIEQIEDWLI